MSIHDQPLLFHTSHGQIISVDITPQTTAGEVKNILCNQATEYQINESDLIYNNEPLQDDQKISEIDPNIKKRIFILTNKGAVLQKFIFKNLIFGTYSLQLDPKTITKIIKKHFIEAHPELIPETIVFKYDRKNLLCDDEKALEEFGTDTIKVTAKKVQQARSQSKAAAPPKRSPAAPPKVASPPHAAEPPKQNPPPTQNNLPKQESPKPTAPIPSQPEIPQKVPLPQQPVEPTNTSFPQQPEPPQSFIPPSTTIPQQPETIPKATPPPDLPFSQQIPQQPIPQQPIPQQQPTPPSTPSFPQQPITPPPSTTLPPQKQKSPHSISNKKVELEIEDMKCDPIDAPTPLPDHNFNGFTPSERQLDSIRACLTDSPETLTDFYKWLKRINPNDARILKRNQKVINRLLHINPKPKSQQIETPSTENQQQTPTLTANVPPPPPQVKPPKIYEEKFKIFLELFKDDKKAQQGFTNLHKQFSTVDPADLYGIYVSSDKNEKEVIDNLKPISSY